ncbi:MAG: 3-isopropylmalate dehydratase small subunit [Pseudomonadales bacterium]|jgi:3-isopropylmalate/(R)-2-methylmalate dehydratase small subunit|nr:3-isopropylmalate dehydratase small subunit [Pseudomonadales bacterium]MDP7358544.1 3-isopropylmalate dehydratase small subunit [Pseudomonadales bacterium]MDP7595132.1 3-isopropylmalate dehydratase small subunit [Pseudomonadales bacterium]HJN48890.1 3-isopropylmalate dehydratase small subunit [Pseudomonadales bacterium]|tara:strand:+ start:100 stop:696 length:597 start_codon:yes stop_codon:yes gene_type:complete
MSTQDIKIISGTGVYVEGNDIDTDRIIPARFLKCVTFDELGPALFYDVRFDENDVSKGHVLDSDKHKGANILISDANFGCGSSREHAPQAIQKFGFSAIIAESFAEIFFGNCTTLGVPCVCMEQEARQQLTDLINADPNASIIVDIDNLKLICANNIFDVTMKESARDAFLSGSYDPLDALLEAKQEIEKTAAELGYA